MRPPLVEHAAPCPVPTACLGQKNHSDCDKDRVLFPWKMCVWGWGGGGIEREAGACFPESPAAPLGLGDSEGLKAGVFKAPLIFVSTESGPAWLWALDKAWLLFSHSGHFLGAETLPPSLQGAPPLPQG